MVKIGLVQTRQRPDALDLSRVPEPLADALWWREQDRQDRLRAIEMDREARWARGGHWWLAHDQWTPHPQGLVTEESGS
jgi:hypothetical protein